MARLTLIVLLALPLLAMAGSVPFTWDNCGSRFDRLIVKDVDFFVNGDLAAGNVATIRATGATYLHAPLNSGAWQVRIYEIGLAKPIYTTFGNLLDALKFTDPKDTTFEMTVNFTLPASQSSTGQFIASLEATDQQHAVYTCLEVKYNYPKVESQLIPSNVDVAGSGPHFWSCAAKDDPFKIKKIVVKPYPPVKGQKVSIFAEGDSQETITKGNLKYVAALDGIPLIHKTDSLCHVLKEVNITCPVKAGPLSVGVSFNIPSWAPSGNYSATAHAYDQNNKELTCLQGYFVLN